MYTDYRNTKKPYVLELTGWKWEFFVTIHLHNRSLAFDAVGHRCLKWFHFIKKRYPKIVFAGRIYVIRHEFHEYPHAHILMVSNPDDPMRLSDLSRTEIDLLQNSFIGPDVNCQIDEITKGTEAQVADYIYDERNAHVRKPDCWMLYPYRNELLEKIMLKDKPNTNTKDTLSFDDDRSMVMTNNSPCSVDDEHAGSQQDKLKGMEYELK
jgi:hypothetical protein